MKILQGGVATKPELSYKDVLLSRNTLPPVSETDNVAKKDASTSLKQLVATNAVPADTIPKTKQQIEKEILMAVFNFPCGVRETISAPGTAEKDHKGLPEGYLTNFPPLGDNKALPAAKDDCTMEKSLSLIHI